MDAWGVTEPMTKFSCEMRIVVKAAGVSDFAERLVCSQCRPATYKARCVIQACRNYELTAGRTALREELLKVAQRDSRFGRHLIRTEIRVGEPILDDAADARKQLVRMSRSGPRVRRRKYCAKEIVEGEPHVGAG